MARERGGTFECEGVVDMTHDDFCESVEVDIGVGSMHSPCGCEDRARDRELEALRAKVEELEARIKVKKLELQKLDDAIDHARHIGLVMPTLGTAAKIGGIIGGDPEGAP